MKKRSAEVESSSSSLPRAKKRLGQNFLADERVIERVIQEVRPLEDETIIEIGPGRGALTSRLVERAGRLIAIEFDRDLIPLLREKFDVHKNFTLVEADALAVDFCALIAPVASTRVVANLPYNIATAILQKLIEQRHCLTEITLILQRELVDRITAPPDSKERSFISVLVEAYCETEKLFDINPRSSSPAPKVWSSVVRLTLKREVGTAVSNDKLLWQVISAGFAQRRKTILNNLRNTPSSLHEIVRNHGGAAIVLYQAKVDLQRRAETLTLDEWIRIVRVLEYATNRATRDS